MSSLGLANSPKKRRQKAPNEPVLGAGFHGFLMGSSRSERLAPGGAKSPPSGGSKLEQGGCGFSPGAEGAGQFNWGRPDSRVAPADLAKRRGSAWVSRSIPDRPVARSLRLPMTTATRPGRITCPASSLWARRRAKRICQRAARHHASRLRPRVWKRRGRKLSARASGV